MQSMVWPRSRNSRALHGRHRVARHFGDPKYALTTLHQNHKALFLVYFYAILKGARHVLNGFTICMMVLVDSHHDSHVFTDVAPHI